MQLLRNPAFLFPLTWLIVNLLQACFTELSADEAYYWMYSRFPAFGYFDHPPVIAFFIRAGYALFDNTLGVRLFTVITEIGTLLICWQLITIPGKEKHRAAFWLLAAAIPVLQVYGFIATPDSPLLFFAALFLLCYRRFLEAPGKTSFTATQKPQHSWPAWPEQMTWCLCHLTCVLPCFHFTPENWSIP